MRTLVSSYVLTASCLALPAAAQCQWSNEFCPAEIGQANQGEVLCTAVFDDRSGPALFVGGSFNRAAGLAVANVAKWNGFEWSNLAGGFTQPVLAMIPFDDGNSRVLVAAVGVPTQSTCNVYGWNGEAWNPMGSTRRITCFAVFDHGQGPRLYAGDSGSQTQSVRLWNGAQWVDTAPGVYGPIHALHATTIGGVSRLIATGNFAPFYVPSSVSRGIAMYTGTAWQPMTPAFGSQFLYTLQDFDGNMYLGGNFQQLPDGTPTSGIAAWDGAAWLPTQSGMHTARRMALHQGVLAAAGTLLPNGTDKGVTTLSGSTWSVLPGHFNGDIEALTSFDLAGAEPQLFAAGRFTSIQGIPAGSGRALARFDGQRWTRAGRGADARVKSLAARTENGREVVYAAGDFTAMGAENIGYIARWDQGVWSSVGGGIRPTSPGDPGPIVRLRTLRLGPSAPEDLYACGSGRLPGGELFNGVIKWDGESWSLVGTAFSGASIQDVAVFGSTLFGLKSNAIVFYNGSDWSQLAGGNTYRALAVYDDGSGPALYVAGSGTSMPGLFNHIARWNGTTWSAVGDGFTDAVYGLQVVDSGNGPQLYALGNLGSSGGTPLDAVARWTGTTWVQAGDDPRVTQLAVADFGNGPRLAAYIWPVSIPDVGTGAYISSLEGNSWVQRHWVNETAGPFPLVGTQSGLWAAGGFSLASGQPTERIARLLCTPPPCYANCDDSTLAPILNVADFTCFLQRFAAADPYANCDASTTQPTLNVADFTCFLQRFAAGCP